MRELVFSSMEGVERFALDEFEERHYLRVHHLAMSWGTVWEELLQIAALKRGPDVSQIGNTWLSDLAETGTLRPFSRQEFELLGGNNAFYPSTMSGAVVNERIMGIPWIVDTRLMFYRRDLLAKAGVDERTAFATPQAMLHTLRRLHETGVAPYPLVMPTVELIYHNLASWVWSGGGEFRTPDGRKMLLMEPEARQGMVDFFKLAPYIQPDMRLQGTYASETPFYEGKAAVLYGGQANLSSIIHPSPGGRSVAPGLAENLGLALPPGGVAFVGGSLLVIWQHTSQAANTLDFVRHLTSAEVLTEMIRVGGFPVRQDILDPFMLAGNPHFHVISECLRRGKAIDTTNHWARVELALNAMILQIFADSFANPEINLEQEVETRLRVFCNQMDAFLLS